VDLHSACHTGKNSPTQIPLARLIMIGTVIVYLLVALMAGLVICWCYDRWQSRKRPSGSEEMGQGPPEMTP